MAFLLKKTCDLRHPMGFRHPVCVYSCLCVHQHSTACICNVCVHLWMQCSFAYVHMQRSIAFTHARKHFVHANVYVCMWNMYMPAHMHTHTNMHESMYMWGVGVFHAYTYHVCRHNILKTKYTEYVTCRGRDGEYTFAWCRYYFTYICLCTYRCGTFLCMHIYIRVQTHAWKCVYVVLLAKATPYVNPNIWN